MRAQVDEVRRRSTAVTADGRVLRDLAAEVAARSDVGWVSSEADRWRADLAVLVRDLRAEADEVDRAAAAMRRHADAADRTLDAVHAAERWFGDRLSNARRVLSSAADEVSDTARDAASAVVSAARSMPSPGSLSWLSFRG